MHWSIEGQSLRWHYCRVMAILCPLLNGPVHQTFPQIKGFHFHKVQICPNWLEINIHHFWQNSKRKMHTAAPQFFAAQYKKVLRDTRPRSTKVFNIEEKIMQFCPILFNFVQFCPILCNFVQFFAILCIFIKFCSILFLPACFILCLLLHKSPEYNWR